MVKNRTRCTVLWNLAYRGKDPCLDPRLDDHKPLAGQIVGRDILEGVLEVLSLELGVHGELSVANIVREDDTLGRPIVVFL